MDNNIQQQPVIPQPQKIPLQTPPLKTNYNWLRTLTIGFAIVSFCTAIGVIGYFWTIKNKPTSQDHQTATFPTIIQPSPTPDPTANWKTYENSTDFYTVKYPPTWSITEENSTITITSNEKFSDIPSDPEPVTYWVNIVKYDNPNHKEFRELAIEDLDSDLRNQFTYRTEIINGQTVFRTTTLPSRAGCDWAFFKKKDDSYISLNFCLYNQQKPFMQQEKFHSLFSTILSTFKFTQ